MTENREKPLITNLLTPTTKSDECMKIVQQLLTPEETTLLGGAEEASYKVVESMGYMGVFAPNPGTFDKPAFLFAAAGNYPINEGEAIWKFLVQTGVFKDESEKGKGRFSISEDLKEMLENTENGYLI